MCWVDTDHKNHMMREYVTEALDDWVSLTLKVKFGFGLRGNIGHWLSEKREKSITNRRNWIKLHM